MNTPSEIPAVLAFDVGNSRIRVAVVLDGRAESMQAFTAEEARPGGPLEEAIRTLWNDLPPSRAAAACSVSPENLRRLEALFIEVTAQELLVVGRELPRPIDTDLPQPGSIGTDRLCNASAAFDACGVPCVVGDFGTAVTIDCVDERGVFRGGAILPGLAMSARALHEGTHCLPLVEPAEPPGPFGRDTAEAISSGLLGGLRGALRGFAESYATELGRWPTVILTGGDAGRIAGAEPSEDSLVQAVVPELTLKGVAMAVYRGLVDRP
jgi:type III pantothenate kinase